MRRADRLFQIIQHLRRRRSAVTAEALADKLGVSVRTVYRDVQDLVASGTPIDGEAGVGYRLRQGYDLPPLMFDAAEIEALVLGARIVSASGDPALQRAAASLLAKAAAVLPPPLAHLLEETHLYAPMPLARRIAEPFGRVRAALAEKRKVRLRYVTEDGRESERTVRPLGAFFWGKVWTVAAWCELRADFRNFRLDRIAAVELCDERFVDEEGRTLRDLLARYGPEALRLLAG